MDAFERVKRARQSGRPVAQDYIDKFVIDFMEMHGDRLAGDDKAIIGGIGYIKDMPVTVIAQQKGKTPNERGSRNSGSPHPEGYRKALRLMKQAEKFKRPILCIVDTSGAYPGIEAENRGQGQAIATNLYEMIELKVPIISIFIGEGGSGGALALAVADEVVMLENAFYAVISPEGCASILWKDPKQNVKAADMLKLTAKELKKLDIVDKVVREPRAFNKFNKVFVELEDYVYHKFGELQKLDGDILIGKRYERFRKY